MKPLAGGLSVGVASAALRGLTLASKFLLVLVLARFFPLEDLGLYGLMVSAVAITGFLLGLEYHYFTIRALIGRETVKQVSVMRDQAVLYAVIGTFALPALAILMLTGVWTPIPTEAVVWFLLLVVVELLAQEAGVALVALSRPLAANLVLFIRWGAWTYPVIALVAAGVRDVDYVFLAWLLGGTVSLATAAWCLRGMGWRAGLREPIDWSELRAGLRIAAPFVVTTGASLGLLFLDRFIIAAYWDLGLVGVYTFFAGIATALHTLVNTGVSLVRMPRLVRAHQLADERRFRAELAVMTKITVLSATVLAATISVGIGPLLNVVGKDVYRENVGSFYLLLGAAVVRSLADLPLYALYARHRDMSLLGINLTAFALAVILNLSLVPFLGLSGAALAAVAGASTLLLGAFVLGMRGNARAPQAVDEAPPTPIAL